MPNKEKRFFVEPIKMLPKLNVPTRLNKDYLLEYRAHKSIPRAPQRPRECSKPTPSYRTILCKFFLMSSCKHGDSCSYSHDTSKFPCKAFHLRRSCTRRSCPFSHEPISDAAMKALVEEQPEEPAAPFKSTLL